MSESASSYNSSSSGGPPAEFFEGANATYVPPGTSIGGGLFGAPSPPNQQMQPSGSPTQANWGVDMLSSSPLTGPGATFHSLRPRPGSFDHGKYPGVPDGTPGYIGSDNAGNTDNSATVGILFEDLPISPFAPGVVDHELPGLPVDSDGMQVDRLASDLTEDNRGEDDEDEDEDESEDMMFFLDSGNVPASPLSLARKIEDPMKDELCDRREPISLAKLLAQPPVLSSFSSELSYVS